MKKTFLLIFILGLFSNSGFAQVSSPASDPTSDPQIVPAATWVEGESLPLSGRPNPYALPAEQFALSRAQGQLHAQFYPVDITGLLPPYDPFRKALDSSGFGGFAKWLETTLGGSGFGSTKEFFEWLGLNKYPATTDTGVYSVALPPGGAPDHLMGLTFIERDGAQGFTFSCAACHSASLFGKTILGLHNRFPRPYELFIQAKNITSIVSPNFFQESLKTTDAERKLYETTKTNMQMVSSKKPLVMGLDTSLAQVALSLAHRNTDQYATRNPFLETFPRPNWLENNPADSKPGVWWNIKYKNRWGSDGAFVRGNPIYTNLLWNEIGRGADLKQLQDWLETHPEVVRDLTTAVFSSEPPKWTDFFNEGSIDLPKAQAGEELFNESCAKCHGHYEKGWSRSDASTLSWKELVGTTSVKYFARTRVIEVGTDPQRWMGMKYLLPVNDLAISKKNNMLLKNDPGYVPPPLVGIWSRWPYFHNNSAPNLCAVLTKGSERPASFYMGEANDKDVDFDSECNGYPTGDKTPAAWKTAEFLYDTHRKGMSNVGHDEGVFLANGQEKFTPDQKKQIIEYLKTL